jgi:hypothetical protein
MHRSGVLCILFHSILVYICTVIVIHLWLEWRCCRFELSTLDVKVARVASLMIIAKTLRNWLERLRLWTVVLAFALIGWLRLILFGLVTVVRREGARVLRTLREVGHVRR